MIAMLKSIYVVSRFLPMSQFWSTYMAQVATCDRRGVTDTMMWRKKCHIPVSVTPLRSQLATCDIDHWTYDDFMLWYIGVVRLLRLAFVTPSTMGQVSHLKIPILLLESPCSLVCQEISAASYIVNVCTMQFFWVKLFGFLTIWCIAAWVTRPERAKDEVKQARRAANLKSGPNGPLDF